MTLYHYIYNYISIILLAIPIKLPMTRRRQGQPHAGMPGMLTHDSSTAARPQGRMLRFGFGGWGVPLIKLYSYVHSYVTLVP